MKANRSGKGEPLGAYRLLRRNHLFFLIRGLAILSLLITFSLYGCGRKTPPEPPGRTELPSVEKLVLDRKDGRVVLEWGLSAPGAESLSHFSGFYVYRARLDLEFEGCRTCRVEFEKIGEVDSRRGQGIPESWYYTDVPHPGFVYFYRVRSYSEYGGAGPVSNTVRTVIN